MDFMRVLDQTVREIKREVNLKVLKVPEMEQKVLDATNDEPWGPHGTILLEIAQATKKFTECQLIMNVLWTRLTDTGPNWRHVYKALTVIEYLVANGSERSVDDILEHTLQISANSGFEYVEPNGKDVGINVRKKAETILALLNDREKIQAVRDKATANRDKFVGLSSTGMTYKSSSTSYGSSSFHNSDHYGSLNGSREGDSFRDSYKEGEKYGKESNLKNENKDSENNASKWKRQVARNTRNQDSIPFNSSKILNKPGVNPSSKSPNAQPNSEEDEFDDFNPRGSSGSANANVNQVDLFGQSLVGDLMDAEPSILPKTTADHSTANSEVDLFADATFQSAPQAEAMSDSHSQGNINLFASQPAFPSNIDLFAVPDTGLPAETKSAETINTESFDPFAAIPVNNFDGSDPFSTFASQAEPVTTAPSPNSTNTSPNNPDDDSAFGAFTSHAGQTIPEPSQNSSKSSLDNLKSSLTTSAPAARKDNFQVKSGIWADCLSRGLIDLNISAPKKVNLADIGIVGGLEDASMEKEKVPPTAFMGRAMGAGSGVGWSGFSTATGGGSGSFSTFGQQQFGNFK